MKALSLISTGVLLLLLGAVPPAYAQEEKHEQEAKPQKQEEQAKPQKQEQAKPAKEEKQAKSERQEQAKSAKQEHVQQVKAQQDQQREQRGQSEQAQGRWARNGQKDSRGHEYNENRFGRDHHARFEEHGGRFFNGRREYSFGGYWFYAGFYPPWFYRQEVYFIMGADGLWYAVAYDDPSLTFQVNIE